MKRKMPTILILMVMVLVGAMYWVDLSYYTDPVTGFVIRGSVLLRYAVVGLPLLMSLLGLRTVGPRAISVLRVKSPSLGGLFAVAAAIGMVWGIALLVAGAFKLDIYQIVLGGFSLWYGVWMCLAAIQLFTQNTPSPTKSAIWGVFAAAPFVLITVYRIMIRPSSLYRVGPLVRSFAALFAMLWFGLLLRSLYIALPRRRVRWMYFTGVFTFLFATCLELPLAINMMQLGRYSGMELLESVAMASLGLVAGCVSVAVAGQSDSTSE